MIHIILNKDVSLVTHNLCFNVLKKCVIVQLMRRGHSIVFIQLVLHQFTPKSRVKVRGLSSQTKQISYPCLMAVSLGEGYVSKE